MVMTFVPKDTQAENEPSKPFRKKIDEFLIGFSHNDIPGTRAQSKEREVCYQLKINQLEAEGDAGRILSEIAFADLGAGGDYVTGGAALRALGLLKSVDKKILDAIEQHLKAALATLEAGTRPNTAFGQDGHAKLRREVFVRQSVEVLARHKDPDARQYAEFLWNECESEWLRQGAIEVLGVIGDEDSIRLLKKIALDSKENEFLSAWARLVIAAEAKLPSRPSKK